MYHIINLKTNNNKMLVLYFPPIASTHLLAQNKLAWSLRASRFSIKKPVTWTKHRTFRQPFNNGTQSSRKQQVRLIIQFLLYINHMFTCAIQADNPDGPVVAQTNRVLSCGLFKLERRVTKTGTLTSYWNVISKSECIREKMCVKNLTFPSQRTRTEGK